MNSVSATSTLEKRDGLASASFVGLLVTQFLGALNDNMFRWLVVPIGKPILGDALALSLGLACFTLPYLLFATLAGFLADRYSKRTVIVICKVAEIVLMALAVGAILLESVHLLFVVVGLMGTQSALFAPSKFGSIPEMVSPERISKANGLMGMVTVIASALGAFFGYALFDLTTPVLGDGVTFRQIVPATAALVGVAVVGWFTSLLIARLPAADPKRVFAMNPVTETWHDLRLIGKNTPLLRTAIGIAFFWMLASLAQMNIDTFGSDILGLEATEIGTLLVVLVVGVGLGSVLAGLWSGGHVELGIVPLGGVGIVFASVMLFLAGVGVDPANAVATSRAYGWTTLWLFVLGVSAGLFNVPLESFLQHRSDAKVRGTILAASNFISFSFMLATGALFYVMKDVLELSPGQVFLVAGLGTVPVLIYIVGLLPQATIRFIVWLLSKTAYRVKVFGRENLPETGGALLVANHVSWLDGIFLLLSSSRNIRMVAYADYVTKGPVGWLCRTFGVIPIKPEDGPKSVMRSLKAAKQAVEAGELVCIFAEGQLTRTGQLQPFQRGMMRIVEGTDAPVVPVYLDGLWGSIFSYKGGRFFWKIPRRWPFPVSIQFGAPLRAPDDVYHVRQAVEALGVEAMQKRKGREPVPPRQFLRTCKRALFRAKTADSSGQELTGGKLLAATLALKRLLSREVIGADETMVGILLPPSNGGVIANAAVTLMRKVGVNLNYTLSDEVVNHCIAEAGIKHVLTSRMFLAKKPMQIDAELVYLEDLKPKITKADQAIAALQAYAMPAFVLERLHGLTKIDPDELLTVIFTSGSTGEPKGVMLSHFNVMSNMDGVDQLFHISDKDVLLGVLPFFHSFGFTGTLWLPLTLNPKVVFHYNPLDARTVGKLCERHHVTITMATPTFLRTYIKRCEPEQLKTLNLVITGAEKLPADIRDEFQEKFGFAPTEGYGTTELSPVAAANVPENRSGPGAQQSTKHGTVGRPFPGVQAKVVNPDTWEDLGQETEGLLLIKGPNVMKGYLNQPEKTAEVIRDGWYNTGDFARIHEDGFVEITGRQSRFSKIGGEMVPHLKIEEILVRLTEDNDTEDGVRLAVTAVPDPKKGERLVVLHRPFSKPVEEVLREMSEAGVPNLWMPDRDCFVEVEEIPVLGTGKLDLRGVKQMALERCGAAAGVR